MQDRAQQPPSTSPVAQTVRVQPRSRLLDTLNTLIRARLTAGMVTVLPVLISIWVVKLIFIWMRDASRWAVQAFLLSPAGRPYLERLHFDFPRWNRLQDNGLLQIQEVFFELMPWHVRWAIALFSILLTLFVLYAVGMVAANFLGRRLIAWLEHFVDRVPLIKTVYRGLKQVLASFAGPNAGNFQRAAMFPMSSGVYALGFITNIFRDTTSGEEYATVYCALTPPTTGFVYILPRKDVRELGWSVEQAVQVIISGGILMPDSVTLQGPAGKAPAAPIPPPRPAAPITPPA